MKYNKAIYSGESCLIIEGKTINYDHDLVIASVKSNPPEPESVEGVTFEFSEYDNFKSALILNYLSKDQDYLMRLQNTKGS